MPSLRLVMQFTSCHFVQIFAQPVGHESQAGEEPTKRSYKLSHKCSQRNTREEETGTLIGCTGFCSIFTLKSNLLVLIGSNVFNCHL